MTSLTNCTLAVAGGRVTKKPVAKKGKTAKRVAAREDAEEDDGEETNVKMELEDDEDANFGTTRTMFESTGPF